jgi:hypothetical protein
MDSCKMCYQVFCYGTSYIFDQMDLLKDDDHKLKRMESVLLMNA